MWGATGRGVWDKTEGRDAPVTNTKTDKGGECGKHTPPLPLRGDAHKQWGVWAVCAWARCACGRGVHVGEVCGRHKMARRTLRLAAISAGDIAIDF